MSKNTTVKNPMKVITGENTRWSYANVWGPKSINSGTPKYSVSLIIPKSDTKTIAKTRPLSKPPMLRASPSSRATPRACRLSQPSRRLSVTATQSARTIRPMPTPTSSTQTPRRHPASWTRISIPCHPFGGLLRCIWSRQHHPVRFQLQRQPWHRLWIEQFAADPCR